MPASIPPEPRRSRAERLADVQRRGRVLRRRRKLVTAATATATALAVAALVFGAAGQLTSGRSGVQVTTAGEGPSSGPAPAVTATTGSAEGATTTTSGSAGDRASSTTTTAVPEVSSASRRSGTPLSTTTSTLPLASTTSTSATTATTVTTASAPTTTTELVCWKSYDPRCGDFHWDPAPTVDPMTVSAKVVTASPKAGEPVTFKLVADSPDTSISPCAPSSFGDGPENPCSGGAFHCPTNYPEATGAWPPPDKHPGHWESNESYTHTYEKPGTYTATFAFFTGFPDCPSPQNRDPYRNSAIAHVTVTVQP